MCVAICWCADLRRSQGELQVPSRPTSVVAIVKGAAAPYASAGVVAEAAEIKKVKQYEARYAGVRIVGFGVEISGAFGPAAMRFTRKMAEAAGGPPHMVEQRYPAFLCDCVGRPPSGALQQLPALPRHVREAH